MRKVTIVVEGGDLGARLALAIADGEELASLGYFHRRDGGVQCSALASADDKGARTRWVKACRRVGLTVARAPWEKQKETA